MPQEEKKYAVRVLRRLQDGTVGVFFIDAETGETLESLDGYEVVSNGNLEGGNEVDDSEDTTDDEEESDRPSSGRRTSFGGGGGDGGGLYSALNNAVPWSEGIFSQIFSGSKARAIEEKVRQAGGAIQAAPAPSQPTQQPQTQTTPARNNAPNALDMGDSLATPPPDLVGQDDNYYSSDRFSGDFNTPAKEERSPTIFEQIDRSQEKTEDKQAPATGNLEDKGKLSLTPGSSGEKRQQAYYGTKDAYYGMTPETKNLANALADDTEAQYVNSGYRAPDHNKQVGGAKSSLHQQGLSFDLNLDKLSDQEKTDVVSNLAFLSSVTPNTDVNMGFYSGSNVIHVDSQARYDPVEPDKTGGVSVMMDRTRQNGAQDKIPDWAKAGLTRQAIDAHAPIPVDKPVGAAGNEITQTAPANEPVTKLDEKERTNQTVANEIVKDVTDPALTNDDLTNAGTRASYGLSRMPGQAEIDALSRTLAGELSPSALNGIVANDPAALAELASMASVYENRVASGDTNPLRASQYNANSADAKNVTDNNYSKFGNTLGTRLGEYYTGGLAGLGNTTATHQYANWADPYWSGALTGVTNLTGDHTFGNIPGEYRNNLGYNDEVREVGAQRVNNQVNSNGGLDGSSLLDPPSTYDAARAQQDEFAGLSESSLGGSVSSESNEPGDSGYGGFSGSSGSGANSGNDYSPAAGSLSPGGSGSNSITSTPPSIDTTGVGSGPTDQEIADNNDALGDWEGWYW